MLAFRVVNTVCAYIREKGLKPGDRFPTDTELSKELGIGIARVRHAMRTLHQLGAVRRHRRAGTYLVHPEPDHLASHIKLYVDLGTYSPDEIDRARAILEQGIAAEAARRRTPRNLVDMMDALETMETAGDNLEIVRDADHKFHDFVLGAAQNPFASIFSKVIAESFDRRPCNQPPRISNRQGLALIIGEHRAILESIAAQKPEEAGNLMYQHVAYPKALTGRNGGSHNGTRTRKVAKGSVFAEK